MAFPSEIRHTLRMKQGSCLLAVIALTAALVGCTEPSSPPELLGIDVEGFLATTETAIIFSIEVLNEDDGPFTYTWDFGDGESSTSPKPSHRFKDPGEYGVSVTVANDAGSSTETTVIEVDEPDADLYFWTQTNANGSIQVTINGITKFVSAFHAQFPGCQRGTGTAEFIDLPYGTYSYTAVAQSGKEWSGMVTLDDNCANIPLN